MFSTDFKHPNVYVSGKHPFYTIIQGFVMKDDKPFFSYGNMQGAYQPIGHLSILINIIDFGMNVQEAGDAARWDHSGSSEPTGKLTDTLSTTDQVNLESGIPYLVVRQLRAKGHQVEVGNSFFGRNKGIMSDYKNGVYLGTSESRVDGQAAG
ncbi:gamma-glutamyltransferase [Psychroflexus torquis]|uniref:gamma-glutamyltransferase n=1 Tax=Psychroflexus torquis TaxID=57029 RepID=UPI001FDF7CA3|nr:gamma-glutamyltransferase [Psychroflexus torquis]